MARFYGHGNEPSDFIQVEYYQTSLSSYLLFGTIKNRKVRRPSIEINPICVHPAHFSANNAYKFKTYIATEGVCVECSLCNYYRNVQGIYSAKKADTASNTSETSYSSAVNCETHSYIHCIRAGEKTVGS